MFSSCSSGCLLCPEAFDDAPDCWQEAILSLQFDHVLIAAATLGSSTAVAVWASARLRVLGLVIGAAAGLLVAALTGHFGAQELKAVARQPFFSFSISAYSFPAMTWVPGAIIPLVFTTIIGVMDKIERILDRMSNEKWRRAVSR